MRPTFLAMNYTDHNSTKKFKFLPRYRGKTAKEVYRFIKGLVLTRTITGPALFSLKRYFSEKYKGDVKDAVKIVGDLTFTYMCGIGFVKGVYTIMKEGELKDSVKEIYSILSVPIKIYFNGTQEAFKIIGIEQAETFWFGEPVRIFNDPIFESEGNIAFVDVSNMTLNE